MQYYAGMICPVYRDTDLDGWYWLEDSPTDRTVLVTSEQLFNLIKKVSASE